MKIHPVFCIVKILMIYIFMRQFRHLKCYRTFNFFLGFSVDGSPAASVGGSMSDFVFDILRFGFSTGCSTVSGAFVTGCSSAFEGSTVGAGGSTFDCSTGVAGLAASKK